VNNGIRLTVIGRRDRLPDGLSDDIAEAERFTALGQRLDLRIAIDYSSRDTIANAAAAWREPFAPSRDEFRRLLGRSGMSSDVDLLIRSGGEKRLSDFLLWECAYAELYFTDRLWPDFSPEDLAAAVAEFHARERRFGALGPSAVSAA
jgi:undecaprenyl diphosphate synthase